MIPKLKSNVGPGEPILWVLLGGILFVGGTMLIRGDIVTTVLICGPVFFVTAISSCVSYFLPAIPRRKNSLSPRARKSHSEESPNLSVVNTENRPLKPDCSMPDNQRNGGLWSQSLLDAALDPIILGLDRDLEIRI